MLVNKKSVVEIIKSTGQYSIGDDVAECLEASAAETLRKACARATANGRRTVMGRDI